MCGTCAEPLVTRFPFSHSGQGVVKLDVQPKCLAVGPGGYTVVVCIGQVRPSLTLGAVCAGTSPTHACRVSCVRRPHPQGEAGTQGQAAGRAELGFQPGSGSLCVRRPRAQREPWAFRPPDGSWEGHEGEHIREQSSSRPFLVSPSINEEPGA